MWTWQLTLATLLTDTHGVDIHWGLIDTHGVDTTTCTGDSATASKISLRAAGHQSNNICSKQKQHGKFCPTFIQNDKKDGPQTAEASRGSVASGTGRQTAANTLQILLPTHHMKNENFSREFLSPFTSIMASFDVVKL